jgi:hypothetical protein
MTGWTASPCGFTMAGGWLFVIEEYGPDGEKVDRGEAGVLRGVWTKKNERSGLHH